MFNCFDRTENNIKIILRVKIYENNFHQKITYKIIKNIRMIENKQRFVIESFGTF